MPYVHRTVKAGPVVEHYKYHSSRIHTKNVKRSLNSGGTTSAQEKVNERLAIQKLRWRLNANFRPGDYHLVLHYFDKSREFLSCKDDLKALLKSLRRKCAQLGIPLKYIAVTETKRMTNIHHHIVINKMDLQIIADIWERIAGSGGVSLRPLDKRGNHAKLAAYLIKESRSTMERYRELGLRGKRYSASRNLIIPEPHYEIISASGWRKDPRARRGASLYKFDDGSTTRAGWHEVSGYPYQEYYEIYEIKRE